MAQHFKVGDLVTWNSEAGHVSGTIVRVHTRNVDYKGYTHHASEDRLNRPLHDVPAAQVKGFESLAEPALDLRWSWNHGADGVWRQLDPGLWELTHNPWALLQSVSQARIESLLRDPAFRQRIEGLLRGSREAAPAPAWLQRAHPNSVLTGSAYFSMEFKAWLQRMRNGMARLTPRFSSNRAVRKYTEQHYLPMAGAYRERAADKGARGVEIVHWRDNLDAKWAALSFGKASVVTVNAQHRFEVEVHLNDLDPLEAAFILWQR